MLILCRVTDEVANETEKNVAEDKPAGEEDAAAADGNKETPVITEAEEKEPEDKVNDRLN